MKRKLFLLLCSLLTMVGVQAQTEWTDDVTNGDGLNYSNKQHFNGPTAKGDKGAFECWTNNAAASFDFNQSFTNVPDGVYELSSQAMYRASLAYGTPTNSVLYATVGDKTFSTPLANLGDYTALETPENIGLQMTNNNAYLNVVPAVMVEGGNVTIGMKSLGALTYCTNGYWIVFKKSTFTFKNVTTTYHAKLVARATTMLATAPESSAKTTLSNALTTYAAATYANVKALQSAINTFLATATETNPLNVTDYITNPSFSDDSGNKKNWIQDLGYKQPDDIYQPTGWNMLYSSAKVNNTAYQTYKTQTDGAKDNKCYYVRHRWGDVYAKVSLHQLVKELPAGTYQLNVAVKGGSSVTDANSLSMTAGSKSGTTEVSEFDKSNYKDYSVQVTKLNADDEIDISYSWDQKSGGEQLYYVDDFRLYYLGDPLAALKKELEDLQASIDDSYLNNSTYTNVIGTERTNLISAKTITAAEETVDAYQAAIDDVQDAIDAFTTAKTNYDALVVEIAKAKSLGIAAATADSYAATSSSTAATALTSTQNLKVAEYTYVRDGYPYSVTLGSWQSRGDVGTMTGQHWDGTNSSSYYEQSSSLWSSSSAWEIGYNQDVPLPAGDYVFKVAGRHGSQKTVCNTIVLTVTNSKDEVIGTVADFPIGDTGLGINTSGATDYTTGEGHTYANGGNGRGWEWRYVKFSLASEEIVNIDVTASSDGSYNQQWVGFCNATLETNNANVQALLEYNVALREAILARDNAAYANVTGAEKTALQEAIDADASLDKTDGAAIVAAKNNLVTKTAEFTGAKTAYDSYVAAKAVEYEDNLPYASSAKFAAIGTAQAAADATSASDAEAKTNAIISAYRKYVESNALAEGVGGIDKTNLISDANFSGVTIVGQTAGAWAFSQTGGTAAILSGESFTDGDGNANYSYFDYNNGGGNNQNLSQTLTALPKGQYLLTVTARATTAMTGNYYLSVDFDETSAKEAIPAIGNTGGIFGRGWNDVSLVFNHVSDGDVTIHVYGENGKNGWSGATRFRLVKMDQVATIGATGWTTFASAYPLDLGGMSASTGDVKAYYASSVGTGKIVMTSTTSEGVAAGTGLMLKGTVGATITIPVAISGSPIDGNHLVGCPNGETLTANANYYVLINNGGTAEFQSLKTNGATIPAGKAYLNSADPNSGARLVISFDEEEDPTAINAIEAAEAEDGALKDGKYLIGNKIVLVKNGVKYSANGQKLN